MTTAPRQTTVSAKRRRDRECPGGHKTTRAEVNAFNAGIRKVASLAACLVEDLRRIDESRFRLAIDAFETIIEMVPSLMVPSPAADQQDEGDEA